MTCSIEIRLKNNLKKYVSEATIKAILLYPLELLVSITFKLCIPITMCLIYATISLLPKVKKSTSHIYK